MKRLVIAAAALGLSAPAAAGHYTILLDRPASGRLLFGHAGLQAADERTRDTLVRVVAPGNDVDQRGTVRVLVMNLSGEAFTFGPDQVTLRLGDGTVFKPTPVDQMEDGRVLVERESRRAATIDLSNRNSLSLIGGSGPGASAPGVQEAIPAGPSNASAGQDFRSDSDLLPGASTLNAIYQLLIPLKVGPQQAWGGYYVFDVPKGVQKRKADQPLTITVRTGPEEHRFSGVLRWK